MKKLLIKVHAGGAFEGHVVFTAIHPQDKEISTMNSDLDSLKRFCETHGLELDEDFIKLATTKLVWSQEYGLIISPHEIDEARPISSAGEYLKREFSDYY